MNNQMRGIYKLVDAFPEKNKYREGRYVVFPYEVVEGFTTGWIYVNWDGVEYDSIGKTCRTSMVKDIQVVEMSDGYMSIQISTNDSQYVFNQIS